jgi:putative addiction module killer protein
MKVSNYITEDGKEPFAEWIRKLTDGNARMRINTRITRIRATGNFGDAEAVGGGVSELKIDYGVGYRVYFAKFDDEIVLLLCGGTKKRQTDDIKLAKEYWSEYKVRMKKDK